MSAFLPGSILPASATLSKAAALFIVRAVSISSGDRFIYKADNAIISGIEFVKLLPGFKSVANATAQPLSIIFLPSAYSSFKQNAVPGRSVDITPFSAISLIILLETFNKWEQ